MCPIEGYEGGTKYLGETGSGYGILEHPEYKIYWSGDETNIATVTDGAARSSLPIMMYPNIRTMV